MHQERGQLACACGTCKLARKRPAAFEITPSSHSRVKDLVHLIAAALSSCSSRRQQRHIHCAHTASQPTSRIISSIKTTVHVQSSLLHSNRSQLPRTTLHHAASQMQQPCSVHSSSRPSISAAAARPQHAAACLYILARSCSADTSGPSCCTSRCSSRCFNLAMPSISCPC
jgi:hypothetical protein